MTVTVIARPDGETVSLSEAKEYLRIGHAGEDALVLELVASAGARVEHATGRALLAQTIRIQLKAWPQALLDGKFVLTPGPAIDLLSVKLGEDDLTERFILQNNCLALRPWNYLPIVQAGQVITIDVRVGYGTSQDVPDDLKLAIKQLAALAYRLRSDGDDRGISALPESVDALLQPYKGVRL
ncbi:MAG: hypothetical protein AAGK23_00190 [Pseudomonadota bacterium]